MDDFLHMLDIQLTLVLFMGLGILAYRLNIINSTSRPYYMRFLLDILLPIMVFHSFRQVTFELLKLSIMGALAATILYTCTTLLGKYLYRAFPDKQARLMHYATIVSNAAFAGLPIIASTFGDAGTVIASVYLVPHRIFTWTVGLSVLEGKRSMSMKAALMKLLKNPSLIAVVLGLLRGLLEIPLPAFVDRAFGGISGMVSPMAMIVIGSLIAPISLHKLFDWGVIYYTSIRLFLIPFLALTFMRLFHFDPILTGVVTILAGMPAGTPTCILAAKYGLDEEFGAKITFVSIIGSVLSVSLWMIFI